MVSLELVPTMDADLPTSFETWQLDELAKPLSTALIRERKGPGGQMLKYIKGADAIAQANRIFGVGRWGYRVLSRGREMVGDQTFYTADVELYVLGCPFPFPGEGEGVPQKDTVDQHAKARKEAVTDALKRALRHYGDQFGLCLYDEDSYVEEADGSLVQVKAVHPSVKPAQPKRVVDARPVQRQEAQDPAIPAPDDVPTPAQLRARHKELGLQMTFEQIVEKCFNRPISDAELTPTQCTYLSKVYDRKASEKATAGAGGTAHVA